MSSKAGLSVEEINFVNQARDDARRGFRLLRETRTISASGTVSFALRIPGQEKLVTFGYQGPWSDTPDEPRTAVVSFDGEVFWGEGVGLGETRYAKLFRTHADVQAISHVHTPHLGAYSQAHQDLPLLYVPNRRFRFTKQLPVYINRRQLEVDFILDSLAKDPQVPAIVEANGGATVWSWKGLRDLVNNIILLEEGAQFQILAAALGGSKAFGPGVLEQQWKIGSLVPSDAHVSDDGEIQLATAAE